MGNEAARTAETLNSLSMRVLDSGEMVRARSALPMGSAELARKDGREV
jgi:hypothetical protein